MKGGIHKLLFDKSKCARLGIQKGRAKYFGEILSTGVFACFAPFEAKCNPGSNDLARLMNSAQNTNQKTNSNIFGRISESLEEISKKIKSRNLPKEAQVLAFTLIRTDSSAILLR